MAATVNFENTIVSRRRLNLRYRDNRMNAHCRPRIIRGYIYCLSRRHIASRFYSDACTDVPVCTYQFPRRMPRRNRYGARYSSKTSTARGTRTNLFPCGRCRVSASSRRYSQLGFVRSYIYVGLVACSSLQTLSEHSDPFELISTNRPTFCILPFMLSLT